MSEDYLATHPDLTPAQVDLVEYAIITATPELFALTPEHTLWPIAEKTVDGLSAAALNVFDAKEIATIFIGLGNEPAQCYDSTDKPARVANKQFSCTCRWGNGCGYCSADGCYPTLSGCGWFGMERCNKICYQ